MTILEEAREYLETMKAHQNCCGVPIVRKMLATMEMHAGDCLSLDNELETVFGLMKEAQARVRWLEGLFDFSDPEIVLHSGPNDPVTKDAVVVLRSHYETRRPAPTNT